MTFICSGHLFHK
jgi:hypothetical protein